MERIAEFILPLPPPLLWQILNNCEFFNTIERGWNEVRRARAPNRHDSDPNDKFPIFFIPKDIQAYMFLLNAQKETEIILMNSYYRKIKNNGIM